MKNSGNKMPKVSLLFIALILGLQAISAQTYKLDNTKSDLTVFGTSNVHDWEMVAEKQSGTMVVNGDVLESLTVTIDAEGLKSGKSGMDKNAYKALNTGKHKTITYKLVGVSNLTKVSEGVWKAEAEGELSISGMSKTIKLPFTLKKTANGFEITGEKSVDMTQFKVQPPTALMGTIKTGEKVTLKFKTVFTQ